MPRKELAASRSGRVEPAEEAKKMKAEILAALKAGKPATAIAKRYKVSTAYIYMLKTAA